MAKAKAKSGKKPFGGILDQLQGRGGQLESVFGGTPIGPAEMTKKIWAYVKRKKLAGKRSSSEGASPPSDAKKSEPLRLALFAARPGLGLRGRSPRSRRRDGLRCALTSGARIEASE